MQYCSFDSLQLFYNFLQMKIFTQKSTAFSPYLHILYGLVISATGNILFPENYTFDSTPTSGKKLRQSCTSVPASTNIICFKMFLNKLYTVHRPKPGDFRIMACIGDSLTTGTRAKSKDFLDTLHGGVQSWII